MQKAADKAANTPPLKSVLSLMKLSGWDPDVFYKFRNVLSNQSPTASAELKQDVKHGISLVWSNYYALDNEKDIAFEIGRLCYNLHEYDSALAYYAISVWDTGKHYITTWGCVITVRSNWCWLQHALRKRLRSTIRIKRHQFGSSACVKR